MRSFSRRDFVTAAAAAAAAAAYGDCFAAQRKGKVQKKTKGRQQDTVRKEVQCYNVFAHTDSVNALAISPDGKLLASGSGDNTVKLWSLPEGGLLKTLERSTYFSVDTLAISLGGKLLASSGRDKTIRLWSLPEGALKVCLMDLKASPKEAQGIQYKARNEYGREVTYTLPCGSPIPPGAVCVCNCVPGSWGGGGQYCTCVPVHSLHYWYPN